MQGHTKRDNKDSGHFNRIFEAVDVGRESKSSRADCTDTASLSSYVQYSGDERVRSHIQYKMLETQCTTVNGYLPQAAKTCPLSCNLRSVKSDFSFIGKLSFTVLRTEINHFYELYILPQIAPSML